MEMESRPHKNLFQSTGAAVAGLWGRFGRIEKRSPGEGGETPGRCSGAGPPVASPVLKSELRLTRRCC